MPVKFLNSWAKGDSDPLVLVTIATDGQAPKGSFRRCSPCYPHACWVCSGSTCLKTHAILTETSNPPKWLKSLINFPLQCQLQEIVPRNKYIYLKSEKHEPGCIQTNVWLLRIQASHSFILEHTNQTFMVAVCTVSRGLWTTGPVQFIADSLLHRKLSFKILHERKKKSFKNWNFCSSTPIRVQLACIFFSNKERKAGVSPKMSSIHTFGLIVVKSG